jgi:hypothetical protein
MKFNLKLLHFKYHIFRVTKEGSSKSASKGNTEFCGSDNITVKHTLFALQERGLLQTTYANDSQ